MSDFSPPTVALTGGSGFIGGHLLTQLLHEGGASVKVLTRKGPGAPPGVSFIAGDLEDPTALERLCSGCACVFHCAGYAHAMDGGGPATLPRLIGGSTSRARVTWPRPPAGPARKLRGAPFHREGDGGTRE